jgi:hypothetical protein
VLEAGDAGRGGLERGGLPEVGRDRHAARPRLLDRDRDERGMEPRVDLDHPRARLDLPADGRPHLAHRVHDDRVLPEAARAVDEGSRRDDPRAIRRILTRERQHVAGIVVEVPEAGHAVAQEQRERPRRHVHVRVDEPGQQGPPGGVDVAPPRRPAGGRSRLHDHDAAAAHDDGRTRRHAAVAVDDARVADHEVGGGGAVDHGKDAQQGGEGAHGPGRIMTLRDS